MQPLSLPSQLLTARLKPEDFDIQGYKPFTRTGNLIASLVRGSPKPAKEEMDKFTNEQIESVYKALEQKKSNDPDKQIKFIDSKIKQLKILNHNLKAHDQYLERYNKKNFSMNGCPLHTEMRKKLSHCIKELENQSLSLEKRPSRLRAVFGIVKEETLLKKSLAELNTELEDSTEINRQDVIRRLNFYENLIEKIPKDRQVMFRKQVHQLLNFAYMQTLLLSISQEKYPVPESLIALLNSLPPERLNHLTPEELIKNGRSEMLKIFEKKLELETEKDPPTRTKDYLEEVQATFVQLLISTLKFDDEASKKRFFEMYGAFHKFEIDLQQRQKNIEKEVKGKALKDVEALKTQLHPIQLELLQEYIHSIELVSPSNLAIKDFFREGRFQKILDNKLLSPENFQNFNLKYQFQPDEAIRSHFTAQLTKEYKDYIQGVSFRWVVQNAPYCKFSFRQSDYGESKMLGGGVCAAINYRWIKRLLKNPELKVKSLEDLKEESSKKPTSELEEYSNEPIQMKDRFVQALYQVSNNYRTLPEIILNKDHLEARSIQFQSSYWKTMDDFLNEMNRNQAQWPSPTGIFDITLILKDGAHAIGCQIDKSKNIYRFWDVNKGFYEFPNYPFFQAKFNDFIKSHYPDLDSITATQYTPKP